MPQRRVGETVIRHDRGARIGQFDQNARGSIGLSIRRHKWTHSSLSGRTVAVARQPSRDHGGRARRGRKHRTAGVRMSENGFIDEAIRASAETGEKREKVKKKVAREGTAASAVAEA